MVPSGEEFPTQNGYKLLSVNMPCYLRRPPPPLDGLETGLEEGLEWLGRFTGRPILGGRFPGGLYPGGLWLGGLG